MRYYHNAIYATWPGNAESERIATRWELVKYLLNIKALTEAQSELIGLGAEVGDNPAQQLSLGEYFLKVQDGDHALASFRLCLRANPTTRLRWRARAKRNSIWATSRGRSVIFPRR